MTHADTDTRADAGPGPHAETDAAVAALYGDFPYPPPIDDLSPYLEGRRLPTWNPWDSWALHFPERERTQDLDILVAGCGTRVVPMLAARMPQARIVGLDLSPASLALSRAQCAKHGLTQVRFHQLPLERVAELGQSFDLVHCHGVLHHLADPTAGLRALADVTRPEGALSLMVYARYGRAGVYMLQDLATRLGLKADRHGAETLQALVRHLPEGHPLGMLPWGDHPELPLAEVADMLLHPRDRAYDVPDVRALLEGAGLTLHRWLGLAQYEPAVSALGALPGPLADADPWDRAAAMELFHGRLITHSFLATHPSRPTAAALFDGEALAQAIPTLSPHLSVQKDGDTVVLTNRGLQIPVQVRGPTADVAPWLKAVDGTTRINALISQRYQGLPTSTQRQDALDLFRQLAQAEVLELGLTPRI